MKVSLQTIRDFSGVDSPVDEVVKKIGAQLGEVDGVVDLSAKYQGIVIARVVSCQPHPDADKLSLCMIDDGRKAQDVERDENGLVQVVCGAPNVREDLLVAWLPPKSTVPATFEDEVPFVLSSKELRGQMSNGMLASASELAIVDDHSGILELDQGNPGDDFAEVYGLNDTIIDIENKMFTHRPDCFGQLGVAREIAGINHTQFASPNWYSVDSSHESRVTSHDELKLEIQNDLPELVPRFCAVAVSGLEVKPSPLWLQIALMKFDTKSINNVVDLTNYVMHLTGQPVHAYDWDKVAGLCQDQGLGTGESGKKAHIVVRHPEEGEKISLLNGKTIEPRADAVMIATDSELIGVGGVMGGSSTEVDENTKNIIIEVANFDMYNIRRTSMEHGLFTEAVTRFNKGQSPLQNLNVLNKMIEEVLGLAGGKVSGPVIDNNHLSDEQKSSNSLYPPVNLSAEFINSRLGLELSADEIAQLLMNVEFNVEILDASLSVQAPFWRTDIEISEDIVEEVGRLYGYDNLPLVLPRVTAKPTATNQLLNIKKKIRNFLSSAGANEVLTYSFVHEKLLQAAGQDPEKAFTINNALSPELQKYRLSLLPSLLQKVQPNVKDGNKDFALFEINKVHHVDEINEENVPREFEKLAMVLQSDEIQPFFQAKRFIEYLCEGSKTKLSYTPLGLAEHAGSTKELATFYEPEQSANVVATINEQIVHIGIVGVFNTKITKALKLPKGVAGFELDVSALQQLLSSSKGYTQLSKFPSITQDITLQTSLETPHSALEGSIRSVLSESEHSCSLETIDIFQPKSEGLKNTTFRVEVSSTERTLKTEEINNLLDMVAARTNEQLFATQV